MNASFEIQFLIHASNPFPEKVSKELLLELLPKIERWDWLCESASRNSVSPLIYYNLQRTGLLNELQPKYKEILEKHYRNAGIRNLKLRSAFIEIARQLLSQGINIIALKGIALQHELYYNPALRPMIDIDILVKEDQAEKALQVIYNIGGEAITYSESKYIDKFKHHYPPIFYKGVAIEIHRALFDSYDTVQIPVNSIWEKAEMRQIEGLNVLVPEKHHQLLFLCHHVFSTLRGGTVKLIWYIDISAFLQKNFTAIYWDRFKKLVDETNANDSVFHSLGIVSYLFKEHFFEDTIKYEINKYCPRPQEILFYIENAIVSPELNHYYQKFCNINSLTGKLKYLKNRMFPSVDFIQKKYQTSGFISILESYQKEFFSFISLGFRILLSKLILIIKHTKRKE
jgi:DNA-directed RNA polymerase subunit N (RpoN/RPB10)